MLRGLLVKKGRDVYPLIEVDPKSQRSHPPFSEIYNVSHTPNASAAF